jgi:hypothetical protein
VEKIHACKNDCILYRGPEFKDVEKCPIYRLDQFKHRKYGGDDENCNRNRRKGEPKKVLCYFSVISHLKRWFVNKEKHKQDAGMIRHLANTIQWRNIDSRNPEFVIDLRNIMIAMSTDGINPFLNNSTHSTWPIVLIILNLPPCLCNKQKYIMM